MRREAATQAIISSQILALCMRPVDEETGRTTLACIVSLAKQSHNRGSASGIVVESSSQLLEPVE